MKENLQWAQAKYKAQHDKTAEQPKFEVKSNVWLYDSRTPKGLPPKLINQWTGPYYVSEKLSDCNFRLRHLKTHKAVKSVVHANCLRPYHDPQTRPNNPPVGIQEPLAEDDASDEDDDEDELDEHQSRDKTSNEEEEDSGDEEVKEDVSENDDQFWVPEKILRAYPNFRGEGKLLYKVRYRNTSKNKTETDFTYHTNLPEDMRKDYHIKYTYSILWKGMQKATSEISYQ